MEVAAALTSVIHGYTTFFDDSSEESDIDDVMFQKLIESRRRKRRRGARQPARIKLFFEITIPMSTDWEFQADFRITRRAFERLLDAVGPMLGTAHATGRKQMNPQKQLLAVIWLLATPDCYRSVGKKFDMGKSSLFTAFYRVIRALNAIAATVIKWPDAERRMVSERAFYAWGTIPGVIGAVDGTYVRIKAPSKDAEVYNCRKMHYGITLQAICDHELRFIDCFAGFPSSVSDNRIFRNSPIYEKMLNSFDQYFDAHQFIIGDKAYPCERFCIPPYIERQNVTARQKHFNGKHASTRQLIERSFALLFGRWRRLCDLDMNRTDLIPFTIMACCVLHNICLDSGDALLAHYETEGATWLMDRAAEDLAAGQNIADQVPNAGNAPLANGYNPGLAIRDGIAATLDP